MNITVLNYYLYYFLIIFVFVTNLLNLFNWYLFDDNINWGLIFVVFPISIIAFIVVRNNKIEYEKGIES